MQNCPGSWLHTSCDREQLLGVFRALLMKIAAGGYEETQWLKHLPYKHEDQHLGP